MACGAGAGREGRGNGLGVLLHLDAPVTLDDCTCLLHLDAPVTLDDCTCLLHLDAPVTLDDCTCLLVLTNNVIKCVGRWSRLMGSLLGHDLTLLVPRRSSALRRCFALS